MPLPATPVTLVAHGSPITPARQGTPVTIVGVEGQPVAVLSVGDTFETEDGGTVTIDTVADGLVTGATYVAP